MTITKLTTQCLSALAVATLACGCITISPESAVKTHEPLTYRVDDAVPVLRSIQYGSGSGYIEGTMAGGMVGGLYGALAGATVGAVGGIVSKSMHTEEIAAVRKAMEENRIDIPAIVRAKFIEQLGNFSKLQPSDSPDAALMQVTVQKLGFDREAPGDTRHVPYVVLNAQMVDKSGKVIWESTSKEGYWHSTPPQVGTSLKQYATDPNKLRSDWEQQITIATRKLMRLPIKKYRR